MSSRPQHPEADAPTVVHGASRVDTLPDGFSELLKKRNLALGSIIGGRYRLKALLGDGAMGQVMLAENTSINANVAVKVLKPELLANPEFRKRFQQEAEAMASVEHPNVARFLDLVVGDPTFFVMEYVRGSTLEKVLSVQGSLDPARAVAIAVRIAWGLDAAHAVGVIHRDLKPANLVLAPDREHGEMPKVIDFGLAKLAATTAGNQLTRSGQLIGTPHYMAPEQIEGRDVDARTDVYALGCVLYEMLTGDTPFSEVREDVQILYRQLHEKPRPPSERRAGISGPLDAVVLKALEKAPADRWSSMQELVAALEASRPGRPSGARAAPSVPAVAELASDGVPRPITGERTAQVAITAGLPREAPRRSTGLLVLSAALTLTLGMIAGIMVMRVRGGGHGDAASPPPAAAPAPAPPNLFVLSRPAGATVELDGKPLGTTPLAVAGEPGEHSLRLRLDGHMEVERPLSVRAGTPEVIELALRPAARVVRVRTVPSGAMVYLDDELIAATSPAEVTIDDADFHTIRVEKLGFESAEQHIAPDDRAAEVVLNLEVEKLPRGFLIVDADVVANVLIDDLETGFQTPSMAIRVAAGPHVVRLVDDAGRKSPKVNVDVLQGETKRITLSMGGEGK